MGARLCTKGIVIDKIIKDKIIEKRLSVAAERRDEATNSHEELIKNFNDSGGPRPPAISRAGNTRKDTK